MSDVMNLESGLLDYWIIVIGGDSSGECDVDLSKRGGVWEVHVGETELQLYPKNGINCHS